MPDPELTTRLEPEIAKAIELWVLSLLRERRGRGTEGKFFTSDGVELENSYRMVDLFSIIHEVAPDAIAIMLQKGAEFFVFTKAEDDHAPNP